MAAAAPGEVLLPPVKRLKPDPSCPENSSAVPATATAGWSRWSTLPSIADSLLDTNDIDAYLCLRGVCPSWRAVTDDPKNNTRDSLFRRFQPLAWIILHEDFQGVDMPHLVNNIMDRKIPPLPLDEDFRGDNRWVLVNTATCRFLRKKLSLLLDYYIVGTSAGFFVLADRSPPHTASVFNPLTGYMLRFAAPMPTDVRFSQVVSSDDSLLKLALFCDSSRKIYTADADSERFLIEPKLQAAYDFLRKAAEGGVYARSVSEIPAVTGMFGYLSKLPTFSHRDGGSSLVGLAGTMLLILAPVGHDHIVFQIDNGLVELTSLQCMSNYAIFLGHQSCMAVNVDKFPGIEANCVYYTKVGTEHYLGTSARIYKSNIKTKKVERISEKAVDFVKRDGLFVLVADRPFTIVHLLSSYTINVLDSQLRRY